MKIDVKKTEKENVHALLFSKNPDITEKLQAELVSDSYNLKPDGSVECSITEHDINNDGLVTVGTVVVRYKRLDLNKLLAKLATLGYETNNYATITKDSVYRYLNDREILIPNSYTVSIIDGLIAATTLPVTIRITAKPDSIVYFGSIDIPIIKIEKTEHGAYYPSPHTLFSSKNNSTYSLVLDKSMAKFSIVRTVDYMADPEKIDYSKIKFTVQRDQERILMYLKDKYYYVKMLPISTGLRLHKSPLDAIKFIKTGTKIGEYLSNSPLCGSFLTNDVVNGKPTLVLEETAVLNYAASYKKKTNIQEAFNVFTNLNDSSHFDNPSLLHLRLFQAGIDPYQVEIKVTMKLDNGDTVDDEYLNKAVGTDSRKVVYDIDFKIIDSDVSFYTVNDRHNYEVRSITALEEILNPYVGGYRSIIPLLDSLQYRREGVIGNSSQTTVNNFKNRSHIDAVYPVVYVRDSVDSPYRLRIVDYWFNHLARTTDGVPTDADPEANSVRDFFYTYLQQLTIDPPKTPYPVNGTSIFKETNSVLDTLFKALAKTDNNTLNVNSKPIFTVKDTTITSNHLHPIEMVYPKISGKNVELTSSYSSDNVNFNVFNYGPIFFTSGLRFAATGFFKINTTMVFPASFNTSISNSSFDRSGRVEFYMSMPNLAMLFESINKVSKIFTEMDPRLTRAGSIIAPNYVNDDYNHPNLFVGQIKPLMLYRSYQLHTSENSGQIDVWFGQNGLFKDTRLNIVLQWDAKTVMMNYLSKMKATLNEAALLRVNYVFKIDLAEGMLNRKDHNPFISNTIPVPIYYYRP